MGATNVLLVDDVDSNDPAYLFDSSGGRDLIAHYDDGTEKFAMMADGFIRTASGYKDRYVTIGLGDIAADSDAFDYPLFIARNDITIVDAYIGVDTTIADDNTNYQTMALVQSGSSTNIASMTSDVPWTLHVPQSMGTIDATATKVKAGASIKLTFTKTASGLAMSGFNITLRYTIDQPKATPGTATDNVIRVQNDIGTDAVIKADSNTDRDLLVVQDKGAEKMRIDVNGMIIGTAPDRYQYDVINIGDITTGDSKKAPILRCDVKTRIEKIWIGVDTSITVNSNANHWKVAFTDATNTLATGYLRGPYGPASDLTQGVFLDIGNISGPNRDIAAAGVVQAELSEVGTGPNISSLTIVVCYRKLA